MSLPACILGLGLIAAGALTLVALFGTSEREAPASTTNLLEPTAYAVHCSVERGASATTIWMDGHVDRRKVGSQMLDRIPHGPAHRGQLAHAATTADHSIDTAAREGYRTSSTPLIDIPA